MYIKKEINLMNDEGKAYEFRHWRGADKVWIISFDYNKDPYGQRIMNSVMVSINTANRFYYKIVADGYKFNQQYMF